MYYACTPDVGKDDMAVRIITDINCMISDKKNQLCGFATCLKRYQEKLKGIFEIGDTKANTSQERKQRETAIWLTCREVWNTRSESKAAGSNW
ncbi:hypothetical protein BaRGS_00018088 [Batillaria attramentaria]|uniref:Uncharacterized protein n=1 Tax=Batillaria attramentaria TaxID=370345 RepID=A0ABD0KUH9_9CAEN